MLPSSSDDPMSPPPDAHQRLVTGRGEPPPMVTTGQNAILQVHESRTLQLSPQVPRLLHEVIDVCQVPEGIVSRIGQQYGLRQSPCCAFRSC